MKTHMCMLVLVGMIAMVSLSYAEVGGDLKLWLGDITSGSSWVTDTLGTAQHDTTDRFTMGFSHITLYFTSQISDNVSIEAQPEVSASSGATPRLGSLIGGQRASGYSLGIGLVVAHITVVTPGQFEITAGYLRPIFTEDYGHERFYQENFYSYKAVCNSRLGNLHDAGIEIYKSFDIALGENSYASIPFWLYVLNGGQPIVDNNSNKTLLLHVAPEYANFILYGSGLYGTWDNADENTVIRYSGGLQYTHKYFWFRGEYMAGTWQNQIGDSLDAEAFGYYVKAAVNIVPEKLSLMGCYDYADHNFSGSGASMSTIGETFATISGVLNYQVVPGSHIMLQIDKADWKNEDETSKLDFYRGALGWRTIF